MPFACVFKNGPAAPSAAGVCPVPQGQGVTFQFQCWLVSLWSVECSHLKVDEVVPALLEAERYRAIDGKRLWIQSREVGRRKH
jgi:hypothetical protein